MARPLRIQYPGAYYHVTVRGNARQDIFFDLRDHKTFLKILTQSLDIHNVSLLSYICMTNHAHMLVMTPDGNLSQFMHHFNGSYTSWFNHRHQRVGHLYQGRYKAFLIDADNYLLEVSRYIHLNPIRIEAFSEQTAEEKWTALLKYRWSSLPDYISGEKRSNFVNYKTVLDYMGGDSHRGRLAYRKFIIKAIEQETVNPLELGKGHGIVGDIDFIEMIKDKYLDRYASKREQPALRELRKIYHPEDLIDNYVHLIGKNRGDICCRGKKSPERAMLMEFLYRYCQITQTEIGKLVGGIDYSAVSQARKRLKNRLLRERKLNEKFMNLSDNLLQLSIVKT